MLERVKTDILILGSGGAGLFAALHALQADPDLDITVADCEHWRAQLGAGGTLKNRTKVKIMTAQSGARPRESRSSAGASTCRGNFEPRCACGGGTRAPCG